MLLVSVKAVGAEAAFRSEKLWLVWITFSAIELVDQLGNAPTAVSETGIVNVLPPTVTVRVALISPWICALVRFELELSGLAPTVSWTVAGVLVAAGTLPLIALKVNKLGLAPPRLAIHCAGELEALLMVTVCSAGGVPGPPCDAHMLPPSATVLGDTDTELDDVSVIVTRRVVVLV